MLLEKNTANYCESENLLFCNRNSRLLVSICYKIFINKNFLFDVVCALVGQQLSVKQLKGLSRFYFCIFHSNGVCCNTSRKKSINQQLATTLMDMPRYTFLQSALITEHINSMRFVIYTKVLFSNSSVKWRILEEPFNKNIKKEKKNRKDHLRVEPML